MRQATIWTATAAAVSFGTVSAEAATRTFSLEFVANTVGDTSSGSGFFTIDSSSLTPNNTITDTSLILDFEANFTGTPFGNLTFTENDLDAMNIKTNSSNEITLLNFGTAPSTTEPFLQADTGLFSNITFLVTDDGDPNTADTSNSYVTFATEVPEPGTLSLLAAGAAGVALIRRRRAQRKIG